MPFRFNHMELTFPRGALDDVTRKAQYQPPYVPLLGVGPSANLWSLRGSEPLAPTPEGAVNLGSAAASDAPQ